MIAKDVAKMTKKKQNKEALPGAVNVLVLQPAWSCDAINEIKSLSGWAMGGLDEIQHYSRQATTENTQPHQSC